MILWLPDKQNFAFNAFSLTNLVPQNKFAIVRRFRDRLRFLIEFKRWRYLFLTMTLACFGSTVSLNLALPKARKFNSFWANDLKIPKKVGNMAFEANSGSCGNWFLKQCNVAKTFSFNALKEIKKNVNKTQRHLFIKDLFFGGFLPNFFSIVA